MRTRRMRMILPASWQDDGILWKIIKNTTRKITAK